MLKLVFLFVLSFLGQTRGYLSLDQIKLVQSILKNRETPPLILEKTRKILYHHYYPWVMKETANFSKIHKKAIRRIVKPHSMQQYATLGFTKAIKNYKGSSAFHIYAKPYILGELYKGLTDSTVLKPYRHSQIMAQKNISILGIKNRKSLVSYENYWTFDKLHMKSTEGSRIYSDATRIETIRGLVDSMNLDMRHLFYLRYHSYDVSLRYPVAKICEILCISTETYRKRMNHILGYIRDHSTDP
jgi:hypothetical protein